MFQLAEAMVTLTQCLTCTLGLSLVLSCAVSLAETSSSLIDHKHHFPDPHPYPNPYPGPDPDNTGSRVSDTLKFVVVVSRHGNRGLKDYPLDPYPIDDPKYWPYGSKQLTPRGRLQLFDLGKRVRGLYNGFLNETYYAEELYATSTDTDRTLMSGEAFLAGLYPPQGFQVWDKDVLWQPSSLRSSSPDHTEDVLDCPKFVEGVEGIAETFLKTYADDISEMIAYFNKWTGLDASGLVAVKYLYHLGDKLSSEELEGYSLPKWTQVLYPNPLEYLVGKIYLNLYAGTDDNARLLMGTLLRDVLTSMTEKINGSLSEQRRIHYYSGYDATIVALQVVLGIPRDLVVDFVRPGSALLLELHQNLISKQFYVQALLIKGSSDELELNSLDIPNCGKPCDFYTLVSNSQNFTDVDFDAECESSSSTKSDTQTHLFKIFLIKESRLMYNL